MKRIEVTRGIVGLCHMQVCAEPNVTDEEILAVCNQENPSGTSHGWVSVVREDCESDVWPAKDMHPVPCSDDPARIHFLVAC